MNPIQQSIITRAWQPPPAFLQRGGGVVPSPLVQPTWQAIIRLGHYFGEHGAFPPDAGVGTGERRIQVENTGTDTASSCAARLINRVKRYKKQGEVFARVRAFAEDATELFTTNVQPYTVTASAVAGVGPGTTMTIAGASMTALTNLSTGATVGLTGLNVADYYRVRDGDLMGMEFRLSENVSNGDFENILVFSQRFAQIAADAGGAPGTWGTDDVALSEVGQSEGQITAGGVAYFWTRVLVPDGGNSESNPYPVDVCLEGSVSGSASWAS